MFDRTRPRITNPKGAILAKLYILCQIRFNLINVPVVYRTATKVLSPESPRRQSGEVSDPAYRNRRSRSLSRIPPTAVGGSFRSSLLQQTISLSPQIPPTAVGGSFRSSLLQQTISLSPESPRRQSGEV